MECMLKMRQNFPLNLTVVTQEIISVINTQDKHKHNTLTQLSPKSQRQDIRKPKRFLLKHVFK